MGRRPERFPTWRRIIPERAPESVTRRAARRTDSARSARWRVRDAIRPEAELDAAVALRIEHPCARSRASARASRARESLNRRYRRWRSPSPARALASIHSGLEPVELACRLMITTSLASAGGGRRASSSRSAAASRSPPSEQARARRPTRAARSSGRRGPPRSSSKTTPSHSKCRVLAARRGQRGARPAATDDDMRPRPRSKANNAAPCARSSLSAGSTSRSTRPRPSASSAGKHDCAPCARRACSSCRRYRTAARASAWR